ncbi:MAG: helix-turn-helix domain-containing protein [Bacteriovoracaceae bacterium]
MSENNPPEETTQEEVTQSLGTILKAERERKGYSLKYISQQTKVSLRILENLEDDKFENLPNLAYVAGFVKSYCKVLSLDPEPFLESLQSKEQPNKSSSKEEDNTETAPTLNQKQILSIGVAGGIIVLFVVLINVFNQVDSKKEETPIAKSSETSEESIVPKTITANTPLVSEDLKTSLDLQNSPIGGKIIKEEEANKLKEKLAKEKAEKEKKAKEEKLAKEKAEKEKKAKEEKLAKEKAEKEKKAKEEKLAKEKADKEKKKASKKKSRSLLPDKEINFSEFQIPLYGPSEKKDIPSEWLPKRFMVAQNAQNQNVFIHALDDDTWITYQSDDSAIKKFILKKGRRILIRGDIVKVFMGNVNATKVFLNNRLLDIKKSGSGVKSLVFPQTEAQNYKIPLFLYLKDGSVVSSNQYDEIFAQD